MTTSESSCTVTQSGSICQIESLLTPVELLVQDHTRPSVKKAAFQSKYVGLSVTAHVQEAYLCDCGSVLTLGLHSECQASHAYTRLCLLKKGMEEKKKGLKK